MKILDYLNISNESNLEADSGFVFQKLLIKEILKQRPDWNFYLISSESTPFIDERVTVLPLFKEMNKYKVRFGFQWETLESNLAPIIEDLDLIYINQPELTANFKALTTTLTRRNIPSVGYFHYLPIEPSFHKHFSPSREDYENNNEISYDIGLNETGLGKSIFIRDLESILLNDFSITCSNFGADLLISNAQRLIPKLNKKIEVIHPPISLEEVNNSPKNGKYEEKTIIHNHRLYKHYGVDEFIELMSLIYKKDTKDFKLLFTNPTNGRDKKRSSLDNSPQKFTELIESLPFAKIVHSNDRDDYYSSISKGHISVAPLRPSALWSMSVVDSLACGLPVLCPDYAAFPEILGADSNLLFNNFTSFRNILVRLLNDKSFYEQQSKYCLERSQIFDVKNTAKKFINIFERAVYGK